MKTPEILTPLPGPRAQQLIKLDATYVSPSYTRVYPLVVKRGEGLWIHDVDDNLFLDFTAGIAVCATGHCHPRWSRPSRRRRRAAAHVRDGLLLRAPDPPGRKARNAGAGQEATGSISGTQGPRP